MVPAKLRLWGRGEVGAGIEGTLWGEENVLYFERCIGYVDVCIHPNMSNSTLRICTYGTYVSI